MKASLLTVAAIVALTGALVSCGDSGEVVPDVTPTASTAAPTIPATPTLPSGLPTPAAGYTWYSIRLASFGLVDYAVQAPLDWVLLSEGNPEVIGPSTSTRAGPKLIIHITPPGAYLSEAFRSELPQSGTACEVQLGGSLAAAGRSWDSYTFTCSVDDLTFVGSAADVRVGESFVSVLVFQPAGSAEGDAAFAKALDSFRLLQ